MRGSVSQGLGEFGTLPLLAHQPAPLAIPIALFPALALVVQLLALGEAKLDLDQPSSVEIELERHDRHPLPLYRAHKAIKLTLVQQELARSRRLMVGASALGILGNMSVDQIELAASFIGRISICDVGFAGAQRFHLGAGEHQASLELALDRVVEAGLAVLGDELAALALLRHRLDLTRLNEEQTDFGEGCVDLGL